ncbi:tail assembly chaperone [Escherichia coli]|nr:tail assembly chaperone [Escherichia coli]
MAFSPYRSKEKFEASGLWPDDGVIVSEEEHKKLFMDIPPGKQIGTLNGKPALIDIPQPTKKELIAIAEVKKSQLREKADSEISWRQDAVDADIATDEEATTLTQWKKYRVLLMRVDTSTAPDIEWPTPPAVQAR